MSKAAVVKAKTKKTTAGATSTTMAAVTTLGRLGDQLTCQLLKRGLEGRNQLPSCTDKKNSGPLNLQFAMESAAIPLKIH